MTHVHVPRMIELRPEGLSEALSNDLLVIVFFADWCSPCREFLDVLTVSAPVNKDVTYSLVDVEREPGLAAAFDVESVPKLVLARDGAVVFAHEGALTAEALADVLAQVRALDIEALRRAAAELV